MLPKSVFADKYKLIAIRDNERETRIISSELNGSLRNLDVISISMIWNVDTCAQLFD